MLRLLARVLFVGLCMAMAAQQSNVGSLVFGDECRDHCPDDGSSHRCPPNCMSCACVAHGTPVSMAEASPAVDLVATPRPATSMPTRMVEPRPDAIFHVPRPSLV